MSSCLKITGSMPHQICIEIVATGFFGDNCSAALLQQDVDLKASCAAAEGVISVPTETHLSLTLERNRKVNKLYTSQP